MAIEALTAVIAGVVVGILASALAAFLGWNKSGEPFEPRKFTTSIITGVGAGLVIVAANYDSLASITDEIVLGKLLLTIGLAAGFADTVRSGISGAVAAKSVQKQTEAQAEEKSPV